MKRIAAITLLALLSASSVYSEVKDTTRIKSVELEPVTVVGIKQEKRLLLPSAVSTLGTRFLAENEVRNVRELSSLLPNFFMPDYGSRQNSPVFIRGIGSKIQSPSVVFYVDGIPYFESSSFDTELSGETVVEVLRGPQGTLYGRNAIAGVVNIFSISPLDKQYVRYKLSYGSRNDLFAGSSNNIKLNKSMGLSLDVNYHHNDGFFTNIHKNKKADAFNNGSARVKFVWNLNDKWSTAMIGSISYTDQGGYPYGLYNQKTEKVSPVNYDSESGYKRTLASSGLNFSYSGEYLKFNSQTSFQYIKDKQQVDQDFTPKKLYAVTNHLNQRLFSQEFTLRSRSSAGWYDWILGAFAFAQDIDKDVMVDYYTRSVQKEDASNMPTTALAIYHQSIFRLLPNLKLTAGVRYDYEHSKMDFVNYMTPFTMLPARRDMKHFNNTRHFNQFTPKFSLQYNYKQKQMIYLTVAKGYKTGGFNFTVEKDNQRTYDPEYNWNYELGTKFNILNEKLKGELTFFYIDWRNQQISNLVPAIGNVMNNAGHSSSKGWEISLDYRPLSNLEVTANYGYTDARFKEYVQGKKDYSGNNLPMVPKHTLSVGARYELPMNGKLLDKMVFYANAVTNGPIYWHEDNADKQKIYTLLNLKMALCKGPVTWELWSKNATNNEYNVYLFKSSVKFAQKGKPFMVGGSIIVDL